MKKILAAIVPAAALTFGLVGTASAVTDGAVDYEGHPHVGLLIFDIDGTPAWRCSGTLLSPTVLLTAGHCTDGATSGRVWFEADVRNAAALGYPRGGATSVEFAAIHTHPQFGEASFVFHDVGVVILSAPVVRSIYGQLPAVDELDGLKTRRGRQNTTFTAVGYGLQESFPNQASFLENNVRVRMVANPELLQINVPGFTGDFSLLLSNNAATGGTCFGDSGGPNFLGDSSVIAGVTSFGINGNCAGTGGVFRMDRANVLEFVSQFLN